jgi:hypothetical protein
MSIAAKSRRVFLGILAVALISGAASVFAATFLAQTGLKLGREPAPHVSLALQIRNSVTDAFLATEAVLAGAEGADPALIDRHFSEAEGHLATILEGGTLAGGRWPRRHRPT